MPQTTATKTTATKTSRTKKPHGKRLPVMVSPEWLAWRRAEISKHDAPPELNEGEPQGPVGHAYGIRTTTRLIRNYRELHRRQAMDITPQPVIDAIVKAGVKKWVLMGLHGYVGYLSDPRTTRNVDIMVAPSERKKAVKAIRAAWPTLLVQEYSEVVRIRDPNDLDLRGNPKPTIDIMNTWSEFQQTILKEFVVIDKVTKHRISRLEAVLVSKYAAMVFAKRGLEKKELDAVDFRRMVRANRDQIDLASLRRLAAQVWERRADEIERFLDVAMSNEQFML